MLTISEDIIAMITKHDSKHKPAPKRKMTDVASETVPAASGEKAQKQKPLFLKQMKKTTGTNAASYKIGDSKTWNKKTWYFSDCPNHHDGAHFHTHKAEDCNIRKKWLVDASNDTILAANIGDAMTDGKDGAQDEETQGNGNAPNAQVSLAAAFQALHYNAEAQALIADVLEAILEDE